MSRQKGRTTGQSLIIYPHLYIEGPRHVQQCAGAFGGRTRGGEQNHLETPEGRHGLTGDLFNQKNITTVK